MVFLAIVTSGLLVYRFLEIFFPALRFRRLSKRANLCDRECIHELLQVTDLGDWFLLMQIGKNVDCINYKDILEKLKNCLRHTSDYGELKPLKSYEAEKN